MPTAIKPWIGRMERTQHRHPMTVQLFQAAVIELQATGAGPKPYAGARLPKRLIVTPLRLRVMPNSNVLKFEVQNPMDGNGITIEAGQLI